MMNSDIQFERFNEISTFFNVKNNAAKYFNSLSDEIYKGGYLESILFCYLDFLLRNQDSKRFKEFRNNFISKLDGLKGIFKENPNIFLKISNKTFEDFKSMKEKLLKIFNNYQLILFPSKDDENEPDDILGNSRKKNQTFFLMIMQIMLISQIYEEEDNKEYSNLIKTIAKDEYNSQSKILNKLIVRGLQINMKIYNEDQNEDSVMYNYSKSQDDISDRLNILRDYNGNYRILYEDTSYSFKKMNENELNKKIIQKNYENEIRQLVKVYNKMQNYVDLVFKGVTQYIECKDSGEKPKFSYKEDIKKLEKKILKREKKIKENFNLNLESKGNFLNIRKYMDNLKKDSNEQQSHTSEENDKGIDQIPESSSPNIKVLCSYCKQNSKNLTEFLCSCKICELCLFKHLNRIYEQKLGTMDVPCFNRNCIELKPKLNGVKSPESNELIEKYLGKQKLDEMIKHYQSLNFPKEIPTPLRITCPICSDRVETEKIIIFDCDCKICEDCCKNFIMQKASENCGFNLPCFNDKCDAPKHLQGLKIPTSIEVMKRFLGEDKVDQMSFALANQQAKYTCAKCKIAYDLDPNGKDFFMCNSCNAETCIHCKKLRHKGKVCELDKSLKDFLQEGKDIIRICPKCFQPNTKDDHCDKVTCQYCKVDFCFPCSMIRSPTLAHGNHYHRKDCKNYVPWIDKNGQDILNDKVSKDCTECKALGRLCEKPKKTIKEFYEEKGVLEYLDIKNDEEKI